MTVPTLRPGPGAAGSCRHRLAAFVVAGLIGALAVLSGSASASAAPPPQTPTQQNPAQQGLAQQGPSQQAPASGQCSVAQWQDPGDFSACVGKLTNLSSSRLQCLSPPTPETPDSGLAGWFASEPASSKLNGPKGLYSRYGYAGYDYTTYDVGCVSPLTHPTATFEDTVANGEFMAATSVVGASDANIDHAWIRRG